MKTKGFTLIELLVVIAIIALLMAIIMPSLQKAKVAVEEILCRSNIRQYGMAGALYLEDYDAMFPNAWDSIYKSTNPNRQCQWHDVSKHPDTNPAMAGSLWNYIGGGGKVHYCRTFVRFTKTGQPHPNHVSSIPIEPLFCYSMNAFLGGFENSHTLRVKTSDLKAPSRIFFFAEENGWAYEKGPGENYDLYDAVLNDNALCGAPGHPDTASSWLYPLDYDYNTDSPGGYLDSLATFHKTTMQKRNDGMANAVFVDGHVELADPKRTYYYTKPLDHQPPLH